MSAGTPATPSAVHELEVAARLVQPSLSGEVPGEVAPEDGSVIGLQTVLQRLGHLLAPSDEVVDGGEPHAEDGVRLRVTDLLAQRSGCDGQLLSLAEPAFHDRSRHPVLVGEEAVERLAELVGQMVQRLTVSLSRILVGQLQHVGQVEVAHLEGQLGVTELFGELGDLVVQRQALGDVVGAPNGEGPRQ